MSEKKKRGISIEEGTLVVKNKKFKKSDIIIYGVCLLAAFLIWIYASNVKLNSAQDTNNLGEEVVTEQNV